MSCESGAVQARNCMRAMQQCAMPIGIAYMGMSQQEIFEKIRNTDLRETCGYVDVLSMNIT